MSKQSASQNSLATAWGEGGLYETKTYEGVRKLLTGAGVTLTQLDVKTLCRDFGTVDLDALAEIVLAQSLGAKIESHRLEDLLLHESLFAFEDAAGRTTVYVPNAQGDVACLSMETGLEYPMPDVTTNGRAIILQPQSVVAASKGASGTRGYNWLRTALSGSRDSVLELGLLTFAASLLALALPLYTLAVYDQVLTSKNMTVLWYLSGGLLTAGIVEFILRTLKGRILANAAALLDLKVSIVRNARLFKMTVANARRFTSREASAIIRDNERLSNIVTGPIGTALLEMPVFIAYMAVIWLLAGWMVILPITMLILGGGVILRVLSDADLRTKVALRRAEEYGMICDELSRKLFSIKVSGNSSIWHQRFTNASARLAEAEMQRQKTLSYARIATNALTSLIVTVSLATGAILVINGTFTPGVLIAVVAIIWRMMSPVPSVLEAVLRKDEIRNLISDAAEATDNLTTRPIGNVHAGQGGGIDGRVSVSSVLFNYPNSQAPALRNISFEIQPREIVAITGPTGSGKSTVLDLLSGLAVSQLGTVTIDGVFPAQIPQSVLLQSVRYLSRDANMLPVSIEEYVAFNRDNDGGNSVEETCMEYGLHAEIMGLPDGYQTRMSDLPLSGSLVRRIALARVMSAQSRLLLLDEPDGSNREIRARFLAQLRKMRGEKTVVIVTHEPEYISAVDRVLVINQGTLVRDCAPRDIAKSKKGVSA